MNLEINVPDKQPDLWYVSEQFFFNVLGRLVSLYYDLSLV